jgi:hypothetical protein
MTLGPQLIGTGKHRGTSVRLGRLDGLHVVHVVHENPGDPMTDGIMQAACVQARLPVSAAIV